MNGAAEKDPPSDQLWKIDTLVLDLRWLHGVSGYTFQGNRKQVKLPFFRTGYTLVQIELQDSFLDNVIGHLNTSALFQSDTFLIGFVSTLNDIGRHFASWREPRRENLSPLQTLLDTIYNVALFKCGQ